MNVVSARRRLVLFQPLKGDKESGDYQNMIQGIFTIFQMKCWCFYQQAPKISETFGLDIEGPILSGLFLKKFSYPSHSFNHKEYPSLSPCLETETDFWESQSQKLRLTFKSLGLDLQTETLI